ncbi:hypothetical protein [Dechloromonas denitrificans]|nr:hypothetical protein [Dechloromonas denitrificans]
MSKQQSIVNALAICILCLASSVKAMPVVTSSSTTITFDPGFAVAGAPDVVGPIPIPAAFPNYQYQGKVFNDAASGAISTATAGISTLTRPDIFGAIFPNGTGVGQTAPAGAGLNPARLRIDFNVVFSINGAPFGPPLFDQFYFPLAGNVGGNPGDFVSFVLDAKFTDTAGTAFHDLTCGFILAQPGNFENRDCKGKFPIFDPLGGAAFLPVGDIVTLNGFIEFKAKDDGLGTSSIYFVGPSGINPPPEFFTPEPPMLLLVALGFLAMPLKRIARKKAPTQSLIEPSKAS